MNRSVREILEELKDKLDEAYRTIVGDKASLIDDPRIVCLKDQIEEVTSDLLTETSIAPSMG